MSFALIFALFAIGIAIFQQYEARRYKTEALAEKLDTYCDIAYSDIIRNNGLYEGVDSVLGILPLNLRLTYIMSDGRVLYDNLFPNPDLLENHIDRLEVSAALSHGSGYAIRTSVSNNLPYLYYAKYYGNMIIRAALPYDIEVRHFLKPDNAFLYFMIVMCVAGTLIIRYVGGRFGNSIQKLRDFSIMVSNAGENLTVPQFPNDELGDVGRNIAEDYKLLKNSELRFSSEREKLLQHIFISAEGICFFNPDQSVAFYN